MLTLKPSPSSRGAQSRIRTEQRLQSAARAIALRADVSVHLGNDPAATDALPHDPSLSICPALPAGATDALRFARGQCDAAALALRYHSPALHQKTRPTSTEAAAAYDALERTRIEVLGGEEMAGLRHNLDHRLHIHYLQHPESSAHPMVEAAALYLRHTLTGAPLPPAAASIVSPFRHFLDAESVDFLPRFAASLSQQHAFGAISREWLERLALMPHQRKTSPKPEEGTQPDDASGPDSQEDSEPDYQAASQKSRSAESQQEERMEEANFSEGGSEQMEEQAFHYAPNRPHLSPFKHTAPYRMFSRDFDEIIDASALASRDELRLLRLQLDDHLRSHATIHTRLATRLQRLLMAQQTRQWSYDMEDGLIDNARLARLIVSPDRREIYKVEHESPFRDTIVTLLIDNSGSMRGRPITIAAMSVDILARTLERCGVKVEILGFTTRDWKGGQSRKAWEKAGKPSDPGRLNDLRHIIYKSADMKLSRVKYNLGLMLKDGLLKENIDGEALLWAHSRLLARREDRRILMVISDGAPVDDSTLSTNASGYLDQHLREAITQIEGKSEVELLAIGIGHDVTRYYKQAVTISDIDQLGDTLLREMTRLFST